MYKVAPRVGAWIENLNLVKMLTKHSAVAPRVGAWIEKLTIDITLLWPYLVAPRVGAWIENKDRLKLLIGLL